jgi:hypothetical protein
MLTGAGHSGAIGERIDKMMIHIVRLNTESLTDSLFNHERLKILIFIF